MTTTSHGETTATGPAHPPWAPVEPGTRMWNEAGLITFPLTAGSAFLLQTMEPSIAAVLDEHSTFRRDPVNRATRSLASVMIWVYGGELAIAEAQRLRAVHKRFTTTTDGARHAALAARPWAWVLHTGVYTFAVRAEYFHRPLGHSDNEAYYQQMVALMRIFGVPAHQIPDSFRQWQDFFAETVENHLAPTQAAYDFLQVIRHPAPPQGLPAPLRPLWHIAIGPIGWLQHLVTVGTLPPAAREILGLTWSEREERRLRIIGRIIGWTVMHLPERMRYLPIAYEARRIDRERHKLQRLLTRFHPR